MVEKAMGAGKDIHRRLLPEARRRRHVSALLAACALALALGACERPGARQSQALAWSAAGRLGGLRIESRPALAAPPGTTRTVTVVATGDLKGWLRRDVLQAHAPPGGLAYLATRIRALRARDPALLLLDAGDALLGAPSSTLSGPASDPPLEPRPALPPVAALMHALGYDAAALGNVDMALGWPALRRVAHGLPLLGANALRPDGGTALAPYRVVERHGVRVGILALTTPAAALGRAPRVLDGVTFGDAEAAARRWVPVLRGVEHVDVLIGLFHSGLDGDFDRDVALRSGLPLFATAGRLAEGPLGFDLIVTGGAQHLEPRRSADGHTPYGTPILEPGARGNGLAVASLHLEARDGRWRVAGVERHTLGPAPTPDAEARAVVAKPLRRTEARLAEPTRVRFRAVPRKGEFYRCAGALSYAAAVAQAGGDPARTVSLLPMLWHFAPPARTERGQPLRRLHLYRWMRFGESLVQARLTGRQVALLLDGYVRQQRGWRVYAPQVLWPGGLLATVPAEGSELRDLRLAANGAPLRPVDVVPVWLTSFVWYGGLGLAPQALLRGGPPRRTLPGTLREAVFALLRHPHPPLPTLCARWLEPIP